MSASGASFVLAGRYRLDGRIAAGGMGEVWRAVDLVLDRPVAVKLLRDEYAQHPETLTRFRAEARHAAAVSHPGIAQVYDYGEAGPGEPPFLVMELVGGPPLTQLLVRGPLEPARVLDVVAQAAAGLGAAHAAGLVHRDIKPGNLLVGPDGTVKITDFGIAHAAGSAPLTRAGTLLGTPAYLAPERVAGGAAGPPSDLYSLGVVAYECLAGAPPFTGTPVEVALARQYQPLPPLPATVPTPVAALVAEMTARDPALRPASAVEVASRAGRLRDVLNGAAAAPAQAGPGDVAGEGLPATLRDIVMPGPGTDDARVPGTGAQDTIAYGAGMHGPEPLPVRHRAAPRPATSPRALALLAAAVALIVGLLGWRISADPSGAPSAQRHTAARQPSARQSPDTAAGLKVEVNEAGLAGQPVSAVVRQLRQLGLRAHVMWAPGNSDPGTVLSVQPSGRVQVGTTVVVTGAARGGGHGHHHHHGGTDTGNS